MDRAEAHLQRKSDERQARWAGRHRERARGGRTTVMDRWAASLQRKSDTRQARWEELEPLRLQLPLTPVEGPGGSFAVIDVYPAGNRWLSRSKAAGPMGPGGGIVFILILITLALWWLVYRRAWTVRVHAYRDYSQSPVKIGVRLPDEVTAYRAAAELVSGFKADGLDALPVWHAEATADPTKHQTGH